MSLHFQAPGVALLAGDCRELLAALEPDSVDACVTDPPYDLTSGKKGGSGSASDNPDSPAGRARIGTGNGAGGFMGKSWDAEGVSFDPATWAAVLRVLKPGAFLIAAGGSRTFHRVVCAVEDAGFEIRDTITWHHAVGFPKSLNCGNGRGTALKPATEFWTLARKPLSERNVALNLTRWGTGALNIDACRIGTAGGETHSTHGAGHRGIYGSYGRISEPRTNGGRWPANVCFSHADGCELVGTRRVAAGGGLNGGAPAVVYQGGFDGTLNAVRSPNYAGTDGKEACEEWACVPGCPIAELDRQSGSTTGSPFRGPRAPSRLVFQSGKGSDCSGGGYQDSGAASRFFFVTKPGRAERDAGCEELEDGTRQRVNAGGLEHDPKWGPVAAKNTHPCVKPAALMRHLTRLVCPPGGLLLDPFAGSGTTGIAALEEGFDFLGMEREPEYLTIAEARLRGAQRRLLKSALQQMLPGFGP